MVDLEPLQTEWENNSTPLPVLPYQKIYSTIVVQIFSYFSLNISIQGFAQCFSQNERNFTKRTQPLFLSRGEIKGLLRNASNSLRFRAALSGHIISSENDLRLPKPIRCSF